MFVCDFFGWMIFLARKENYRPEESDTLSAEVEFPRQQRAQRVIQRRADGEFQQTEASLRVQANAA